MSGKGLAARGLAVVRGAGLAALAVPALLLVAVCLYTSAVLPFIVGFAVFASHSGPKRLLADIAFTVFITAIGPLPMAWSGFAMTRGLAGVTRRAVSSWTGIAIAYPYRSRRGPFWALADPATWRDLLWLGVNGCGGFLVALAPAGLAVTGIVCFCLLAAGQPGLYAAASMPAQLAINAAILAGGLWVAPACLRGYGRLAEVFLAPSKSTSLADRVRHLEQSLAQTFNAEAALIGRIERDLRDAIRALALDTPVRDFVDDGLSGRPSAPVESAGYFAVREVLANVVKDSGARRVWIDARHDDGMLRLGVTHDGTSPATAGGLHGVERLLAAAGGVVAVSPPGDLTTIAMEIPCAVADAPAMAKATRLAAPVPELACIHNPGVQDAFYVYENWTLRKAVLHHGECRFCNYGRGQRDSGETPNGKWHGPYDSEDMARSDSGVRATSRKRDCQRCMV